MFKRHGIANRLLQVVLGDLALGLLGPVEDNPQRRNLRDEVALYLPFPPVAALVPVEAKTFLARHLVVEAFAIDETPQWSQRQR